jgi:hypothetical protein
MPLDSLASKTVDSPGVENATRPRRQSDLERDVRSLRTAIDRKGQGAITSASIGQLAEEVLRCTDLIAECGPASVTAHAKTWSRLLDLSADKSKLRLALAPTIDPMLGHMLKAVADVEQAVLKPLPEAEAARLRGCRTINCDMIADTIKLAARTDLWRAISISTVARILAHGDLQDRLHGEISSVSSWRTTLAHAEAQNKRKVEQTLILKARKGRLTDQLFDLADSQSDADDWKIEVVHRRLDALDRQAPAMSDRQTLPVASPNMTKKRGIEPRPRASKPPTVVARSSATRLTTVVARSSANPLTFGGQVLTPVEVDKRVRGILKRHPDRLAEAVAIELAAFNYPVYRLGIQARQRKLLGALVREVRANRSNASALADYGRLVGGKEFQQAVRPTRMTGIVSSLGHQLSEKFLLIPDLSPAMKREIRRGIHYAKAKRLGRNARAIHASKGAAAAVSLLCKEKNREVAHRALGKTFIKALVQDIQAGAVRDPAAWQSLERLVPIAQQRLSWADFTRPGINGYVAYSCDRPKSVADFALALRDNKAATQMLSDTLGRVGLKRDEIMPRPANRLNVRIANSPTEVQVSEKLPSQGNGSKCPSTRKGASSRSVPAEEDVGALREAGMWTLRLDGPQGVLGILRPHPDQTIRAAFSGTFLRATVNAFCDNPPSQTASALGSLIAMAGDNLASAGLEPEEARKLGRWASAYPRSDLSRCLKGCFVETPKLQNVVIDAARPAPVEVRRPSSAPRKTPKPLKLGKRKLALLLAAKEQGVASTAPSPAG